MQILVPSPAACRLLVASPRVCLPADDPPEATASQPCEPALTYKSAVHSDMKLTERHYAKWIPDGDEYRAPMELREGEVPADLLARLTRSRTSEPSRPSARVRTRALARS